MLEIKYRPSSFDNVVGQPYISSTLKLIVKSKNYPSCILLAGPSGNGKTTVARIYARAINCSQPIDGNPCLQCEHCLAADNNGSFNLFELDAASRNGVEDMREIISHTRFRPKTGEYKVFIIDEAHMLTIQASNALLKILEDPPSYVKFIFCTTNSEKIIPTVKSRCQIYNFSEVSSKIIATGMRRIANAEKITIDDNTLQLIALNTTGGVRASIIQLEQIVAFYGNTVTYSGASKFLDVLDIDFHFRMINAIRDSDISEIMCIVNEVSKFGIDMIKYLTDFQRHLRNILLSRDMSQMLVVDDSVASLFKENVYDENFIVQVLIGTDEIMQGYPRSLDKHLHTDLGLIKITKQVSKKPVQNINNYEESTEGN